MLCLRRRFHPGLTRFVASAAIAWMGSVALAGASQAATVTFNYTGADVSYTIDPGTYRITVYGAQGGNAADCAPANCEGGRGVEASAIYRIGQTLDLRIGVGGTAPANAIAAGGGGASFVDFEIGDPGLDVLLLVGGGGFSTNGQSYVVSGDGGDGGASLSSGGAPGQRESPGGFGGGGGGATGINESIFGGGGGGGYNGGDAGYVHFVEGAATLVASQGGTSLVENNPPGCGPGNQGPACFLGGLVLAVGAGVDGQGLGNGSVVIQAITGSPVPEPSTWAMMAIGFAGLGFMGWRGSRKATT
jgi:PEP-CTERM motif